jgi:alcohol dehydrogenase (NADP+)
LVRAIGVSNMSVKKLQALLPQARIKPTCNQIEVHPYLAQPALVKYCQDNSEWRASALC